LHLPDLAAASAHYGLHGGAQVAANPGQTMSNPLDAPRHPAYIALMALALC
jgi:hypothetical protein